MSITLVPDLMALNQYAGIKKVQLRGRNAAISNSAETIWTPGAAYARLTSGVAMEAVSSSANDTAAGTGARTIVVEGLNGSYVPFTETVTLNGATPVALANTSAIAINRAYVATAGSGLTNAGNIDVRVVTGSAIKAQISSSAQSVGQSYGFVFTIPASNIGLLKSIRFSSITATGDIQVYLISHTVDGIIKTEGVGNTSLDNTGFNIGQGVIDFGNGLRVSEKTLLELRAINSAGAGDLVAMADLYLFNNADSPSGIT